MRTAATALLIALACLGAGCSSEEDSLLVVSVDGPESLPSTYYLRVTIRNDGQPDYHQFPSGTTSSRIQFPTSLGFNVPRKRKGTITLDIDALDLDMKTVASGKGSVELRAGDRVDLCVGLAPACSTATSTATSTGTGLEGSDGGRADVSTVDSRPPARGGLPVGVRFARVAAGTDHTCAITTDSTLWCWGANASGQLGTGDTLDSALPVQVAGSGWSEMAAGSAVTCALQSSGALWCWGNNGSGQIGNGTAKVNTGITIPLQLADSAWVGIGVGSYHVVALQQDGALFTWGDNSSDQLGDTSAPSAGRASPGTVNTATWSTANRASFSAGNLHTCAIALDRSLWCWGNNATGQLGDGTTHMRLAPTRLGASDWAQVSAGYYHTCALKTDGSLWCWGDNSNGQLGIGSTTPSRTPAQVTAAAGRWTVISAGHTQTCGLKDDGSLWCWGGNGDGQLGSGDGQSHNVPSRVLGGTAAWATLSAGDGHTCAVGADESLWCWGRNSSGQLGLGEFAAQPSPARLGS